MSYILYLLPDNDVYFCEVISANSKRGIGARCWHGTEIKMNY